MSRDSFFLDNATLERQTNSFELRLMGERIGTLEKRLDGVESSMKNVITLMRQNIQGTLKVSISLIVNAQLNTSLCKIKMNPQQKFSIFPSFSIFSMFIDHEHYILEYIIVKVIVDITKNSNIAYMADIETDRVERYAFLLISFMGHPKGSLKSHFHAGFLHK